MVYSGKYLKKPKKFDFVRRRIPSTHKIREFHCILTVNILLVQVELMQSLLDFVRPKINMFFYK
jgi:hypothetical protein